MTPPPVAAGAAVSPVDAAHDAVEHTRQRLFPFDPERWLVLGLLAFLDQCGRGGNFPGSSGGGGNGGEGLDTGEIAAWASSHVGLIVAVTAVGLTLLVALLALVLWVNTRGVFMYLDAVVTGRVEVRRPWREHAEAAGSLFLWRFALALGMLLAVLIFLAVAAAVVLGAPAGQPPLGRVVALLLGLLLLIVPLAVATGLVSVALRDFVAPLQLHLRCDCARAAGVTWALVRARPGTFVVYVLLKIVFAVTAGVLLVTACCFTCCLAIVPVLSQALLQPLWFFERAWSVCLLRRMGYDLFASFPGAAGPAGADAPAPSRA